MTRARAIIGSALLAALVAGIAAWALHDPRYRTAKELDHAAYPLRRIDLDPPGSRGGIEYFGTVRFDLYIGTSGKVDRVELLQSTMPGEVRDRVVKAFAEARWQPGRKAGREVRSVKRVEIDFPAPAGVRRLPMQPDS